MALGLRVTHVEDRCGQDKRVLGWGGLLGVALPRSSSRVVRMLEGDNVRPEVACTDVESRDSHVASLISVPPLPRWLGSDSSLLQYTPIYSIYLLSTAKCLNHYIRIALLPIYGLRVTPGHNGTKT